MVRVVCRSIQVLIKLERCWGSERDFVVIALDNLTAFNSAWSSRSPHTF